QATPHSKRRNTRANQEISFRQCPTRDECKEFRKTMKIETLTPKYQFLPAKRNCRPKLPTKPHAGHYTFKTKKHESKSRDKLSPMTNKARMQRIPKNNANGNTQTQVPIFASQAKLPTQTADPCFVDESFV